MIYLDGVSAAVAAAEIVGVAICFPSGIHQQPPPEKKMQATFLSANEMCLIKHFPEDRLQIVLNETDGNTKTKSAEPQTRYYFKNVTTNVDSFSIGTG